MKPPCCCQIQPHKADPARRSSNSFRRAWEIAGWLLPSTVLALLPKCPVCLAAYVALGTGFMMSPSSASLLLRTVTLLCFGALAFCLARRMMKYLRQSRSVTLQLTRIP